MSDLMLVTGLASVAIALLVLALIVVPGGPGRVPISRLDPTAATQPSALAGAGAAAVMVLRAVISTKSVRAMAIPAASRAAAPVASRPRLTSTFATAATPTRSRIGDTVTSLARRPARAPRTPAGTA